MLIWIAILINGIFLILMGVDAVFVSGYRSVSWGRYINYGPYRWVIGIIFIIGGLYFVYNATKMIIRDKRKGRPPRESG